jgi:Tol biopolymer transport system component
MIRCLSILAVSTMCAAGASAASAPSGKIVFSSASGVGGKTQIWMMNANGTARHAISPSTSSDEGAALSADGKRIGFGSHFHLYVMNANGSGVRRLTSGSGREGGAAWSPDGRWIAYDRYSSGKSAIWKMRPDGSHKTRLSPPALSAVPTWSPNGLRVAYVDHGRIWLMNADGSGRHAITHTMTGVDWAPSWSRDGRRIAFESNRATGPVDETNEIWVMNADGSHQVRLTHNSLADNHPVWSPDGSWIAFASELPHPGTSHIWVMHPNGKNLHRVSSSPAEEYYPSWSR